MAPRVQTGEDARPAHCANRRSHEIVLEYDAVPRQLIRMWRLDYSIAGATERVPPLIVGEDHEEVRRAIRRGGTSQNCWRRYAHQLPPGDHPDDNIRPKIRIAA
jgi:hypothetical protein